MKESERYIVMDGCMFLSKCPTKMCLAKRNKEKKRKEKKKKKKRSACTGVVYLLLGVERCEHATLEGTPCNDNAGVRATQGSLDT